MGDKELYVLQNKEVERLTEKYNKSFLDCEDLREITGLGRDNVRCLLRSKDFPTTRVGRRQVVSVLNFVVWFTTNNFAGDYNNVKE